MKLKDFDPLDYLRNKEDCNQALIAAYEEDPGDGSLIASTLSDIAKVRGMSNLPEKPVARFQAFLVRTGS